MLGALDAFASPMSTRGWHFHEMWDCAVLLVSEGFVRIAAI
jgi:hypothetical protein